MDQQRVNEAAELLLRARRGGERLAALPHPPADVAEAHAIQIAVAGALGQPIGAFKANAPANEPPNRGLIFAPTIRPSPARVPSIEAPDCGVEGEIAFRFRADLPARATDYTRAEVADAMEACAAIEVVSGRFRNGLDRSRLEQLADCICNGGLVPGPVAADWRGLDLARLPVTLRINGAVVVRQSGGHPSGDPLGVAVALVNMQRQLDGVRAGQFVTTGSCTGLRFLKPGDHCGVHFEGLGEAELSFVG